MTLLLWARIKREFDFVSQLHGPERLRYLDGLGERDPEALPHVQQLLAQSSTTGGFLDTIPWRPPTPAHNNVFAAGQILADRFEIREFLGRGGVGEVYRAYDRHREAIVALKTLRPLHLGNERAVDDLRSELNVASLVTHHNVCRLYDMVLTPTDPNAPVFITMEYLPGETLSQRLRRRPLTVPQAKPLVEQIAAGLAAAHERGIIHRDLKPANIMLVPEDNCERAVIMDFGLARETRAGSDLQTGITGGLIVGTPAYMAPEQLTGGRVTRAADVYALGVVIFEMTTGKLPFPGDSALAIALARFNEKAPRASSLVDKFDSSWDHAIARCLAFKAADRPATPAAVLHLLKTTPPLAWPRRVAAIAALAVTGSSLFIWLKPHHPNADAQLAVENAEVFMANQSKEGYEAAIERLQLAIRLDSLWAQPRAELAYAYAVASNARFLSGNVALPEARRLALEAIQLDPRLAKAHAALGWTESLDFDNWPKAEASFTRAITLDPNDWQVRYWYATYLRKKGNFQEAERQINSALQLTHQREPSVWCELAFLYWTSGQSDNFDRQMDSQLRAFPNFAWTRFLNARRLKLQGKFEEARSELDFSERLGWSPLTALVERASIEAYAGNTQEALADLHLLEKASGEIDGLLVAGVYAKLGLLNRAFEILEAAYKRKDSTLLSLATSPVLAPLREMPQYNDLCRRLHFGAVEPTT